MEAFRRRRACAQLLLLGVLLGFCWRVDGLHWGFFGRLPSYKLFGFLFWVETFNLVSCYFETEAGFLENPQKWISFNNTLIHSVFNYTQLIDNMMVKMDKMKMDDEMMDGKLTMTDDKMNGKMMVQTVVMMKYDGEKLDEPRTPQRPLLLSLPRMLWNTRYSPSIHPHDVGFQHREKIQVVS